jgi:hypothetical protein
MLALIFGVLFAVSFLGFAITAEYCTAKGWSLDDIMRMNIDKLKERYPDGFKAEQSLHRKAGDI